MNRWSATTCLAFVLLLGGCLQSPALTASDSKPLSAAVSLPDLTTPGAFKPVRLEYDFGPVPLVYKDNRGVPYPSRVVGSIHFPESGKGPFPLIVLMHGRHGTCRYADQTEFFAPIVCPDTPATKNIRSYTGYDYLAEPLASHGYVVVSIDANNLNDLDLSMGDAGAVGRAQLISKTLDEFSRISKSTAAAPIGDKLVGRIDFDRIGLMGHSRGGEGVTRFISWNQERTDGPKYALSAVFALAPTDFARWKVTDVVHAALLPYCDGDVSNLQGAWMYDDARYLKESKPSPKIQILAMGSNHNNYNTIWTGDDGGGYRDDAHCGPSNPATTTPGRRLSPDDQRRHGRVYMEAFFRYYVGGEPGFGPLFTGAAKVPSAACPAAHAPCEDVIHVSYHSGADRRLVIEDSVDESTLTKNDLGTESRFEGFSGKQVCVAPNCAPAQRNFGRANMLVLDWEGAASWRMAIPAANEDAARFDALTFRVVTDPANAKNGGLKTQGVQVVLTDRDGATSVVDAADHSAALFVPPGKPPARRAVPNEVRLDLELFAGVDLSKLAQLEFRFKDPAKGSLLVTDVLLQDEPET